ncbi:MAG: hypothetical protein V7L20_19380 [Nostoc sp.]
MVERRGGYPEYLLGDVPIDLLEHSNHKKAIAKYLTSATHDLLSVYTHA